MKYCMKFDRDTYPISEEEIPKIIRAMDEKLIVVLKCGVFSGSYIKGVVKDIHGVNGWNYGYIPKGEDNLKRGDYVTDIVDVLKLSELNNKLLQ